MSETLTAQQKAQLFAMSTRQNLQMLAKQTAAVTPTTLQFNLPKARLLSNILLRVKGKFSCSKESDSGTIENAIDSELFTPFKAIRRISLDLNNGFQPFVISGAEAAMLNLVDIHPNLLNYYNSNQTYKEGFFTSDYVNFPSSVGNSGYVYDFGFTVNLPVTTSPRDPIGLILLQNDQTNVTINIDLGTGADMLPAKDNCVYTLSDVSVEACLETFSLPANANAVPDLSVLKLTMGRTDSIPTAGQQVIKLTTGQIYRKIIFRVLDENGLPTDTNFINSDISLVFNQADVNYSISPEMLRLINARVLGYTLPKGTYFFDFSNGGSFPNMGGTRDFIDSANLTEFWLKFNTTGKGKVDIVTETLSRLT